MNADRSEIDEYVAGTLIPQIHALQAAAKRTCAAWWGSFGGSDDPEGEWDGLDETERHYWRTIADAARA